MRQVTLAGYVVTSVLASGQTHIIYAGRRTSDDRRVAIKVCAHSPASSNDIAALRHEFELLCGISSSAVATALDLVSYESGVALIVQEAKGELLEHLLVRARPGLHQALRIAVALSKAVAELHACGIIHKDLKPHHVLYDSETSTVQLIDFGIATKIASELAPSVAPDKLEGTLAYLSPEQTGRINGSIDRRSDLYSLGVVLYELFVGVLPFVSTDPLELLYSHVARIPVPPSVRAVHVPEQLSALILKLLAKSPEERYQSALGVHADLVQCLQQLEQQGHIRAFPLALHDYVSELRIPNRLYGRTQERTLLHSTLARISAGTAELVLVSGYSGIGKTALISDALSSDLQRSYLYATGKFEQLSRSIPYAAVAHAVRDVLTQILALPAADIAEYCARIRHSLGGNTCVLAELLPELVTLVGEQQSPYPLGPAESQNRFDSAIGALLVSLAMPSRPLVLLLDDLQWADPASLRLIQVLLASHEQSYLLLIGAYRSNEVDAAHPLQVMVDGLRREHVSVCDVELQPLPMSALSELLDDTFVRHQGSLPQLAELIYQKTRGNPFFIGQFLRSLYREQHLRCQGIPPTWEWDLQQIAQHSATDNVVEFLVTRLQGLHHDTQHALRLAACIGFEFALDTLATVAEQPATELARALWPALQDGLLIPLDTSYRYAEFADAGMTPHRVRGSYRFLHDRVQQAAYQLIPEERRAAIHLRIGRSLQPQLEYQPTETLLFDVVGHLNLGRKLIREQSELLTLADLNYQAGASARKSTAFAHAGEYFETGLSLLEQTTAAAAQPLYIPLLIGSAESESLCGHFARSDARFAQLDKLPLSDEQRASVTCLQAKVYQISGRYREGLEIVARTLARFDIVLPDSAAAMESALGEEIAAIAPNQGQRSIEQLADAPLIQDPRILSQIELLANAAPCAYIGKPEVFPFLALRMLNLSLRHGNTPASCFAYSVYGFMLVAVFQRAEDGLRFSQMSLHLNEKLADISLRGTLLHLHGDHINFWKNPIREDLPILDRAFVACQQAGDHVYGNYLAFETPWQLFEVGDRITDVLQSTTRFLAFASRTHNDAVFQTLRLEQQFLKALSTGTSEPLKLADGDFSPSESLAIINRASFGCGTAFYHIIALMLAYIRGDLQTARAAAEAAVPVLSAVMAMPIEATYHYYRALVLAQSLYLEDGSDEERAKWQQQLTADLARLELFAKNCPANFACKFLLARAESKRFSGELTGALADYDAAIEAAASSSFVHYEAQANELAGRCYLAMGRLRVAALYLDQARERLIQWGATAWASHVAQISAALPPRAREQAREAGSAATSITQSSTQDLTNRLLDVSTVLGAAQVIASEIQMRSLLARVLRTILTTSSAQRVVLLLSAPPSDPSDRGASADLAIMGVATAASEDIRTDTGLLLSAHPQEAPGSVVSFVLRTRETVLVSNVQHDARFASDPYVQQHRTKSVLALPLLHQGLLSGVLYLDHTDVSDAFSVERAELLRLLCTQVSISVENARLYAQVESSTEQLKQINQRLEQEVLTRTTELQAAHQHVLQNSAELAAVNQRLQHELEQRKLAEESRHQLQEQIIRSQQQRLAEMATPMIPISKDIVIMPLIGTMDSERAAQVLDSALQGVDLHRARFVIIDITGLRHVDTAVAKTLMNTAHALMLLGAQAILTGIRAEVAQTLVSIGVSLDTIPTLNNLQRGIAYANRVLARSSS